MTKPGMSSEPSMDEILASIRKIIAEEPALPRGAGDAGFAALVPSNGISARNGHPNGNPFAPLATPAAAAPAPSPAAAPSPIAAAAATPAMAPDRGTPLMERIATAVRSERVELQTKNGGDLDSIIRSDLGDMLDEPPARGQTPTAKPAAADPTVVAATPAPVARAEPYWPKPEPAPVPAAAGRGSLDPSFAAQPVAPVPAEPAFPATLFPAASRASGPAATAPAAADAFGAFVPVRSEQALSANIASRLPPLGPAATQADLGPFAAIRPGAALDMKGPALPEPGADVPAPPAQAAASLAASPWPETLRRASQADLVEARPSAPSSEPVVLAAMPAPKPAAAATRAPAPTAPAAEARAPHPAVVSTPIPAVPGTQSRVTTPARGLEPEGSLHAEAGSAEPVVLAALNPAAAPVAKPVSAAAPLQVPPAEPDKASAASEPVTSSEVSTSDADTKAAVASALGALAAGLAASSSKPVTVGPAAEPHGEAVVKPVTAAPAVEPQPAPAAAAAPSDAFLALAGGQQKPAGNLPSLMHGGNLFEPETALDDTVAELLRPMLRQWLADNMPRIVEKALRIELAESLKAEQLPNERR